MQATTQINRQGRGCGFEPAAPPGVGVMPWQPPLSKLGYKHGRPKLCAGYTTRLPEVMELARAHSWWSKSQLQIFLDGAQATQIILDGVEILDAEVERMKAWAMTPIAEGGGRA